MKVPTYLSIIAIAFVSCISTAMAEEITEEQVAAAQKTWGDGIVKIGKLKGDAEAAKKAASEHLDTLYAYDLGKVLFKPTKAADDQFRETKGQALSYFVGGEVPEDKGFALQPWTKVRFENHGTVINGKTATAMGNYFFTTTEGDEVKVEYSFCYIL
ncbi:MAG: hypothetical protein AAF585_28740, partial [Verrucomicrobiota bacterium]